MSHTDCPRVCDLVGAGYKFTRIKSLYKTQISKEF